MEVDYIKSYPSNQNAVDIFKGHWKSKFPDWLNLVAGKTDFYSRDSRVEWALAHLNGSFGEYDVLEVGPFEGYNTYQLSQMRPNSLTSIEMNNISYLKCLISKEILQHDAKIMLGDSSEYFKQTLDYYDLIWLSGVLYHLVDPVDYLFDLSRRCDNVFIWTHFYEESYIDKCEGSVFFKRKEERLGKVKMSRRKNYNYYNRYYNHPSKIRPSFSGGSEDYASWMSEEDIRKCLLEAGFTKIVLRGVNNNHVMGPTLSLLASKD